MKLETLKLILEAKQSDLTRENLESFLTAHGAELVWATPRTLYLLDEAQLKRDVLWGMIQVEEGWVAVRSSLNTPGIIVDSHRLYSQGETGESACLSDALKLVEAKMEWLRQQLG